MPDVEQLRSRLKELRDRYVRELRKMRDKRSGDVGPAYMSSWPHFQSMGFLEATIKHRK